MKKQRGIALLEVLIAVSIVGFIMLYMAQLQRGQVDVQSRTLNASKIAKIYQLTTQVMFEPLVEVQSTNSSDIETFKINNTIKNLKNSLSGFGYIYLPASGVSAASSIDTANFFNGVNGSIHGCGGSDLVKNERVNCTLGLEDEFNLGSSYKVRGIKIDGEARSFFSINHTELSHIRGVKPTSITVFIDGLQALSGLNDIYALAEAASQQVSQIDDMENSAYANIHIADFNAATVERYDTGFNAHEVLTGHTILPGGIRTNMGLAIVFDLEGTQALRSDGMVAIEKDRPLCWNVETGTAADDYICQSAMVSDISTSHGADGDNKGVKFLNTDGSLVYLTSNQEDDTKIYRTPVEVVVESFGVNCNSDGAGCAPVHINKPVCPKIGGDALLPHLSVVGSSYSNSGHGVFPNASASNYGDNSISDQNNKAEIVSGVLFRWTNGDDKWDVTGIIGSPNDVNGDEGRNPKSLQIVALRWCEGIQS
ncbi:type IV pilus modification PilV family protein [Vibrio aestuarianus]|uniref:type IV pilus modification PilV family protein n=1 Tax=Vibrio aestuarianus TaxID=28171 RepID=UPI00237CE669|nr:prepilin-type N-terminal cleavage/methylation domain-containing protein [Vibrio aestuarianus]MDE1210995.1 prepilin-type N-terminal cleavage/methylation domain-containing protein [Vibrio aestuarianus]